MVKETISAIPQSTREHLMSLPNTPDDCNALIDKYEELFLNTKELPEPQRIEAENNLRIGALLQSNTGH